VCHALPSPVDHPTPPVSCALSFSLAPALPLTTLSRSSAPSLSPVIGQRRDCRWPPPAPSPRHYSPTSKVWHLASSRPMTEPSRHHRLPEPSRRHHCAPSSPSQARLTGARHLLLPPPRSPIKGPLRAPYLLAPASAAPSHSLGPIELGVVVPPLSGEPLSPLSSGLKSNCYSLRAPPLCHKHSPPFSFAYRAQKPHRRPRRCENPPPHRGPAIPSAYRSN
jgi:hypothetical protein